MQVSQNGDLANWMIPGKMVKGMGGAMDLVAGAQCHCHYDTYQQERFTDFLKECNLPLTGEDCVQHVITDLGWFDIEETDGKRELVLKEIARETVEAFAKTDAEFRVADNLIEM